MKSKAFRSEPSSVHPRTADGVACHLFEELLDLPPPWKVTDIRWNMHERRLDLWLSHEHGMKGACPECTELSSLRDHSRERVWRHLDSCQCETYVHARIPRVACPFHGIRQVLVPWADPDSRFTRSFERRARAILSECRISQTAAILGITWDEARGIQRRRDRFRHCPHDPHHTLGYLYTTRKA